MPTVPNVGFPFSEVPNPPSPWNHPLYVGLGQTCHIRQLPEGKLLTCYGCSLDCPDSRRWKCPCPTSNLGARPKLDSIEINRTLELVIPFVELCSGSSNVLNSVCPRLGTTANQSPIAERIIRPDAPLTSSPSCNLSDRRLTLAPILNPSLPTYSLNSSKFHFPLESDANPFVLEVL